MAVLTNNIHRPVRLPVGGVAFEELQLAGIDEEIYIGSILLSDVGSNDGYFRALPDATAAAGDIFGGISLERISVVSADADGDKVVSAARDGVWGFAVGSLARGDVGSPAYASDDDTITTTASNNQWVGTIVDVDATFVYVDISKAWMMNITAT